MVWPHVFCILAEYCTETPASPDKKKHSVQYTDTKQRQWIGYRHSHLSKPTKHRNSGTELHPSCNWSTNCQPAQNRNQNIWRNVLISCIGWFLASLSKSKMPCSNKHISICRVKSTKNLWPRMSCGEWPIPAHCQWSMHPYCGWIIESFVSQKHRYTLCQWEQVTLVCYWSYGIIWGEGFCAACWKQPNNSEDYLKCSPVTNTNQLKCSLLFLYGAIWKHLFIQFCQHSAFGYWEPNVVWTLGNPIFLLIQKIKQTSLFLLLEDVLSPLLWIWQCLVTSIVHIIPQSPQPGAWMVKRADFQAGDPG